MTALRWHFATLILREDGTPVRQLPIATDLEPLHEWLRFQALQRGIAPERALSIVGDFAPRWHERHGPPALAGVQLTARVEGAGAVSAEVGTDWFHEASTNAAAPLVEEGVLAKGERIRFRVLAFERDVTRTPPPRFATSPAVPPTPVGGGLLAAFLSRALPVECADADPSDMPVFLPARVKAECLDATHAATGIETGGLLIGHLRRDEAGAGLFVQVTAQLPARHVDATRARLTFTAETWTTFRAALALRSRDEIPLGWWHSHPVRAWCQDCSIEHQRTCALRGDFLSPDDRLLHRTVFPRAWSLALVVNDIGFDDPTFSLFGWRAGSIALRSFHLLDPDATGARHIQATAEVPAHAS